MDLNSRTIDSESIVPLYKQLFHYLNSAIENHEFKPGDRIPSENELAREFNISRVTIRHALQITKRTTYDLDQKPVEYIKLIFQASRYRYKVELFRPSKPENSIHPKEVPGKKRSMNSAQNLMEQTMRNNPEE
jgi:DNA-binding transcriptional MocR family regulator